MNRCVITGIGMVTPIGRGKSEFWENCLNGRDGIVKVEPILFEEEEELVGGQINKFNIKEYYKDEKITNLGRAAQFFYDCLNQSISDANIESSEIDGVYLGTTMGESSNVETINRYFKKNLIPEKLKHQNNQVNFINDVLEQLEITGVTPYLMCNACSGGNYAIIGGYESIRNGENKCVVVGGIDPFSAISLHGFKRLGALAEKKCRPYSRNRDGMLVSEGGCVLILEDEKLARKRNATIYAEISGYGLTSDAFHINAPHPEGQGLKRAIEKALNYAEIQSDSVDYISLHGTGTKKNDQTEANIIKNMFSSSISGSSIKSMIGHTMGAASAIEAAVCCLAIKTNRIPPTINFEEQDPECAINCIPNNFIEKEVNIALNLSAGFGGTNAALLLKEYSAKGAGNHDS